MKKTILLVVAVFLALGLVPLLAEANHCPGGAPPAHSEVATNPVTGGHIYTSGLSNAGTHGTTGWVQVGTGGVQGASSDGTTASGHVGADGIGLKVANIGVSC